MHLFQACKPNNNSVHITWAAVHYTWAAVHITWAAVQGTLLFRLKRLCELVTPGEACEVAGWVASAEARHSVDEILPEAVAPAVGAAAKQSMKHICICP